MECLLCFQNSQCHFLLLFLLSCLFTLSFPLLASLLAPFVPPTLLLFMHLYTLLFYALTCKLSNGNSWKTPLLSSKLVSVFVFVLSTPKHLLSLLVGLETWFGCSSLGFRLHLPLPKWSKLPLQWLENEQPGKPRFLKNVIGHILIKIIRAHTYWEPPLCPDPSIPSRAVLSIYSPNTASWFCSSSEK